MKIVASILIWLQWWQEHDLITKNIIILDQLEMYLWDMDAPAVVEIYMYLLRFWAIL